MTTNTQKKALLREVAVESILTQFPYIDPEDLSIQIEQVQLNESTRPLILAAYASGQDLYTRIVRRTIQELRENNLVDEDSVLLQEGFWDSVQSGIGSFAGGVDKFLKMIKIKKEPKGWEQANRIFLRVAKEEGNDLIKDIVKAVEEEVSTLEKGLGSSPDSQVFPVNKHKQNFFSGVNTLASFYDSIVAAAQKDPGADGYMPVPVANEIIEQLRIVVQKYIADTEREKGGMYASFGGGEAEEEVKEESFQRALKLIKEEAEDESDKEEEKIDPDAEYEKIMRGKQSPVFERMGSMKAPLIIAGSGVALGALGWIAQCSWFQDWILELLDISKTKEVTTVKDVMSQGTKTVSENIPTDMGALKPGEGVAKAVTRMAGGDGGFDLTNKASSLADLKKAALHVGGGDLDAGLKGIAGLTEGTGKPKAAYEAMKAAIEGASDPSKAGSLWSLWTGGTQMAGDAAAASVAAAGGPAAVFTTMAGNQLKGMIIKKVIKTVTVQATKTTVTTVGSAKAAAAVSMISGAGAVLGGIGVGAIAAGATLAYIRKRAKKKSRMGTLQDLLNKLDTLDPPEVEVEPSPEEDTVVTITLESRMPKVGKSSILNQFSNLYEATKVEIQGLTGDDDLENTGGKAQLSFGAISIDKAPIPVKTLDSIPFIKKKLEKQFKGLDLDSPNVEVQVFDNRKEDKDDPPPLETPPVPVKPGEILKGQHAVCVFGPDGAKVWRILKKKTYQKYASDAKRSGDKDAPKFADRYKRYEQILLKLKADGVFVNSEELQKELSKISSGKDGDQWKVSYTRTRKGKRRKSTTGGYTNAGPVSSIADIRKNILGANARPPRGVNDHTVIYLVDDELVSMVRDVKGVTPDQARKIILSALSKWSKEGKRPKIADLGASENVGKVLKVGSLAEAFSLPSPNKVGIVPVDYRFFIKVLSRI